jgi:hypothetical protein
MAKIPKRLPQPGFLQQNAYKTTFYMPSLSASSHHRQACQAHL